MMTIGRIQLDETAMLVDHALQPCSITLAIPDFVFAGLLCSVVVSMRVVVKRSCYSKLKRGLLL